MSRRKKKPKAPAKSHPLIGEKLVCFGTLKWTKDGELIVIEPGDVFEFSEEDVAITRVNLDLLVSSGTVAKYNPRKVYDAQGGITDRPPEAQADSQDTEPPAGSGDGSGAVPASQGGS